MAPPQPAQPADVRRLGCGRRREFAEIAKRIAETLKWLIEAAYAGRKIMVWAHNAHVMNARYGPGFGSVSPEPLKDGMMPSGVWFTDSYGDSLYNRVYCLSGQRWLGRRTISAGSARTAQ